MIVEQQEFAESRKNNEVPSEANPGTEADPEGFMDIPEGMDEELPFR